MTSLSMYEALMGDAFERLSPPVKQFHRFAGQHTFSGQVEVHAPASLAASILALCLGSPLRASTGPIRFELNAQPDVEVWTRHFPASKMRSTLTKVRGRAVEYLGAARLTFELLEARGALEMRLERLHFLGIPCPAWLIPQITAIETGDGDKLYFRVQAAVRLIGTVASYNGHLTIAPEAIS